MFPRDKRGDGTMIWILVCALLAIVVMGFGISFITDFFKGTKSDTDALQACEGLVGQLAGGTGFCFADKQCRTVQGGQPPPVENGQWVYVGDKGCSENAPGFCCVLVEQGTSPGQNAVLERTCNDVSPGTIALVTKTECVEVTKQTNTPIDLADAYTAVRYYFAAGDPSVGETYSLRLGVKPKESSSGNIFIDLSSERKRGLSYVEFPFFGALAESNDPNFLTFLRARPESRGYVSGLNAGGELHFFLRRNGFADADLGMIPIKAPSQKICSDASDDFCKGKLAIPTQPRIDPATGLTVQRKCSLNNDGVSCKETTVVSNPGNVACEDILSTVIDSSSECYGKIISNTPYGLSCMVQSKKLFSSGTSLRCSLVKIDGKTGICREEEYDDIGNFYPECT